MVQGFSNSFGTIVKSGMTTDGRVVYQINDEKGEAAGRISLPQQDCDVFEKSYNDMMKVAPKLQASAEKYSNPEFQEKAQKINKWSRIIGASAGFLVPAIAIHKGPALLKILATVAGTIAGLFGGALVGTKLTTPPGAMKFARAMQNMSKLDIQPAE